MTDAAASPRQQGMSISRRDLIRGGAIGGGMFLAISLAPALAMGSGVLSTIMGAVASGNEDTGGGASVVGGLTQDAVETAKKLVDAKNAGKLRYIIGDPRYGREYSGQVSAVANGANCEGCAAGAVLDLRVMQIMQLAIAKFGSVGVSDLNRRCYNTPQASGTASAHWRGMACDFTSLGGSVLNGYNAASVNLLKYLDPIVPPGCGVGQAQGRIAHGVSVSTRGFTTQFSDSLTHLHMDFGHTTAPLSQ